VDAHGFFALPPALEIARAMREVRPLWLEDVLRLDNTDSPAPFERCVGPDCKIRAVEGCIRVAGPE
jgi:L-alanine-DL-glutamate epimerase-like enolase superfamily enzyme